MTALDLLVGFTAAFTAAVLTAVFILARGARMPRTETGDPDLTALAIACIPVCAIACGIWRVVL